MVACAQSSRVTRKYVSSGSGSTVCSVSTTGFSMARMKIDKPLAALAAEKAVLVLNVDEIDGISIDELGGSRIACAILLADAADDFGRIAAHLARRVRRPQ